jgi:transcriptional regulator with XRE-family HTH domain
LNLGRAISLCRAQRGLTLSELATRAALSVSYLSLLEQNKRRDPTLSTVQKIAEALRIPTGILFFLAADKVELSGLDVELAEKLSHAALTILNESPLEQTLL